MDNATTNGVWQVGGGLADNPVGNTAILTVFNSNNYIVQYIAGANSCFVRIKQTNWQPWVRIDNFGCNTASELASLLGAIELKQAFAGSNLYTKIFAFTLSDASGECSQLDIVHYDVNGTYGAFTIFYSKWNTNSYCGYGCHQYSIVKRKGNVIYLGFSGGSGYGMVKYNVMGNQSVTVSEVSSIPSDAIDVNFPGDFPAFYKNYNSLAELKEALAAV